LYVIGHPCGLPQKYAPRARVRDNTPDTFFVANLDTYGGNSGSPVFNSSSNAVEGILVRGENDFVSRGSCYVSMVCPTTGCRGEDVTRSTVWAGKLPKAASVRAPAMTPKRRKSRAKGRKV
jgi:Peptidase S46